MSNWGTASLEQGTLPSQYRSTPEASTTIGQPQPPHEELERRNGFAANLEAGNMLHARDVLLQGLEQSYILESRTETKAFLRLRPTAITLLTEASTQIDIAFGRGRIKSIRLVRDDFEGTSLFGIVLWPDTAESGREALERLDEAWWLRNCNRAEGIVNFNIELV